MNSADYEEIFNEIMMHFDATYYEMLEEYWPYVVEEIEDKYGSEAVNCEEFENWEKECYAG